MMFRPETPFAASRRVFVFLRISQDFTRSVKTVRTKSLDRILRNNERCGPNNGTRHFFRRKVVLDLRANGVMIDVLVIPFSRARISFVENYS